MTPLRGQSRLVGFLFERALSIFPTAQQGMLQPLWLAFLEVSHEYGGLVLHRDAHRASFSAMSKCTHNLKLLPYLLAFHGRCRATEKYSREFCNSQMYTLHWANTVDCSAFACSVVSGSRHSSRVAKCIRFTEMLPYLLGLRWIWRSSGNDIYTITVALPGQLLSVVIGPALLSSSDGLCGLTCP